MMNACSRQKQRRQELSARSAVSDVNVQPLRLAARMLFRNEVDLSEAQSFGSQVMNPTEVGMLNDEQRLMIAEGVGRALEDFDQSGAAFTAPMVLAAIKENGQLTAEQGLDEKDAQALVAEIVTQRVEELTGGPRQLVQLEADPEPKWGFKDA
jgi:hypothetical protein